MIHRDELRRKTMFTYSGELLPFDALLNTLGVILPMSRKTLPGLRKPILSNWDARDAVLFSPTVFLSRSNIIKKG